MTAALCAQNPAVHYLPCGESVFTPQFFAPYQAAIEAALEILCEARSHMPGPYDIRSVTFRLKSPASIRGKLLKKRLPASAVCARAALQDIAGLRVVLASTSSVYRFAALLRASSVWELIEEQDYIAHPKQSGYRSLHLIVRIPVRVHNQLYMIPAEIQLRTAPMDIWASIEHELIYKPVRN